MRDEAGMTMTQRWGRTRYILWLVIGACALPDMVSELGDSSPLEEPREAEAEAEVGDARAVRLTAHQVQRAIRHLLGIDTDLLALLPHDATANGFDNAESVASIGPQQVEAWLDAVELASAAAATRSDYNRQWTGDHPELEVEGAVTLDGPRGEFALGASVSLAIDVPVAGDYELVFDAGWLGVDDRGTAVPQLDVDGVPVLFSDDEARRSEQDTWYASILNLSVGPHMLRFFQLPPPGIPGNAAFEWRALRIVGPTEAPPTRGDVLISCLPESPDDWAACARTILEPLQRRAWRRPLDQADVQVVLDQVLEVREQRGTFEEGIQRGLQRILLSPWFLFRIEGPESTLDAHALASRLAFFLWSSLPDDELMADANSGALLKPGVLRAHVQRMLQHPNVDGLERDFVGQWLAFRDVRTASLAYPADPDAADALREAMFSETLALAERLVQGGLSVQDMLTTPVSSVDPVLAEHYGVVAGESVDVSAVGRTGLLGHASIHALTSSPGRTSVPRRGQWVLGRLLCDATGERPPDVAQLDPYLEPAEAARQHSADPVCASCHVRLDPVGLALEHFGPEGAWRDAYPDGSLVDASGVMPDGTELYGAIELAALLSVDERLGPCAAATMATWAFGRGADALPKPLLADLHGFGARAPLQLAELAEFIATHPAFSARLEAP